MVKNTKFIEFSEDISNIELPNSFTFPFYYTPHKISIIAAKQLQNYLENQTEWKHNFGLNEAYDPKAIGKMFGVLVVKDKNGNMGFLAGFSGKLAGRNHFSYFVPPVYDVLNEDDFYKPIEDELNKLNAEIEVLENDPQFLNLQKDIETLKESFQRDIDNVKKDNREAKKKRKELRDKNKSVLNELEYQDLLDKLGKESVYRHYILKDRTRKWNEKIKVLEDEILKFERRINKLKETRKTTSSKVQERIFQQYSFKNIQGDERNLKEIFENTFFQKPPAGAGECAAPKLLQYAFIHNLQAISLAEFWWGQSPKSEIRKHKQFYPACKGKCEPILGHMLKGMAVDPNPLLESVTVSHNLEIHYEDEAVVIINKPPEFLSVPGKNIKDSVLTRLQKLFPNCSGPLLLHRLDMSTSGILIMAKSDKYHRFLQRQFIKRTIKKRYVALLDGKVEKSSGVINLPLRGDLYDRPRQIVCFEHGKESITEWKLIHIAEGKSRVYFYPKTGRTHQLRVHAAHFKGLDIPIVGDDLYGTKDERLMLHAEQIALIHPVTRKEIEFTIPAEF